MRKRDQLFAGAAAIAFLAFIAWALSKQSEWVQGADHLNSQPAKEAAPSEDEKIAPPVTRVIGNVDDETRRSLDKHFQEEREAKARKKPEPGTKVVP